MDLVFISRLPAALTVASPYIFLPIIIGTSVVLVYLEVQPDRPWIQLRGGRE